MSNTETANANGNGSTAVVPGSNVNPNAFILSAQELLQGLGKAHAKAQRMEQSAYQTVCAVLFAIAQHGGVVPASQRVKGGKDKDISVTISFADLSRCDEGGKDLQGKAIVRALNAFVEKYMGCGSQTAGDIVKFAARLAATGTTLEHYNGTVLDDGMSLHIVPNDDVPNAPKYKQPGMFRVKPAYVVLKPNSTSSFYEDARVGALVPRRDSNGEENWVVSPFPSEDQWVVIDDSKWWFVVGQGGAREDIGCRVGRQTFMTVTGNMLKARKAAELEAANPTPPAKPETTDGTPAANGSESDDTTGTTPQAPAQTPPQATPQAPQAPAAPAEPAKPATPQEPAKPANPAAPDPAKPAAPAKVEDTSKADVERTREDAQKLLDARAWAPDKVAEHVRNVFQPNRIKEDSEVRQAAVNMFCALAGALEAAGYSALVKNPTPANAKDAMRGITLVSPNVTTRSRK